MVYPEGYEIPIHRSVTETILVGGAPRQFAMLNGTVGASLALGMQIWQLIPLALITHALAAWAAKYDPQFFDVFVRALRHRKHYGV